MFIKIVPWVFIVDLFLPFALAIPYKGYRHTTTLMSVLGCKKSPLAPIYNTWMVISGTGISLFGLYLYRFYYETTPKLAVALAVVIVLYGLGDEAIAGIFPCNESEEVVTLSSTVHVISSVIGFIAVQFSPLILGMIQRKTGNNFFATFCFVVFALSFLVILVFTLGNIPKLKGTVLGWEGLWQRLHFLLIYLPFLMWCMINR